jgi:hypothetical protein
MTETGEIILAIIAAVLSSGIVQYIINKIDSKKSKIEKKLDVITDNQTKTDSKVDQLSERFDEHRATLARTHILRFADELRNGTSHSDEYFRQQLQDIDTYDKYCNEHPEFANGLTRLASKYIQEEAWNHYHIPANSNKE